MPCKQRPTTPILLALYFIWSDVTTVLWNTCQPRSHCSDLFGKNLPSNFNNAQRSPSCLPCISHARTLRRCCETRVIRVFTAQKELARLYHPMGTTPNDRDHAYLAFHVLGLCDGAVKHVSAAFSLLKHNWQESTIKFKQRPTIPITLTLHFTCSDFARCCETRVNRVYAPQTYLARHWNTM